MTVCAFLIDYSERREYYLQKMPKSQPVMGGLVNSAELVGCEFNRYIILSVCVVKTKVKKIDRHTLLIRFFSQVVNKGLPDNS